MNEAQSKFLAHHKAQFPEAYVSGILDPLKHNRLVSNAKSWCGMAGLDPSCLWEDPKGIVGEIERSWVGNFRNNVNQNTFGLTYMGTYKPPAVRRMGLVGGRLMRNQTQPYMTSAGDWVQAMFREEEPVDFSVLMIYAIPLKPTEIMKQRLEDTIQQRCGLGIQTVLAFDGEGSDLDRMIRGSALQIVKDHYVRVP